MLDDLLTITIPTSPIPSHPSTALVEECIGSLRVYFPQAEIILMCDGVRAQIYHRLDQYREYLKNLSKLCGEGKLGNTEMRIFSDPSQQAIMTRNTIQNNVHTPLMMFVEHDAMLRTDPKINFQAIFDLLLSSQANIVRFYAWDDIWHEHEYLMRGEMNFEGSRFVKTVQYSQWPLVSRTDYHRAILDKYFVQGQRAMIETVMYGPVAASKWEDHKIVIYLDGVRVITHKDGRTDQTTGQRDPAEW